jgi:hypothetical protein
MSALAKLQAGDWLTGPDGTQWRVVDPTDRHDTVHLEADAGTDCWVARDECRRKLVDGTFEHTTERPEGER